MGVVYEAEQISLGRRVALKVLPFAATLDPRQLQRFKNEAHAAACLQHQHIVPVHFVGYERGVHYYAMQYIDGQPLNAVIRQLRQQSGQETAAPPSADESPAADDGPPEMEATTPYLLSPAPPGLSAAETAAQAGLTMEVSVRTAGYFRSVARLGEQAALALQHAHDMGIIHRDVKPGNLLLDGRGNLWVTDFGLARVQVEASLTLTGDLVGTVRYMSPEQALAKRVAIDHRTDIYSVGATLYELLTLHPAFNGGDRQELLRQITFEEPRSPRRLNKAIPAELETIVLKALEKNPADRYATAKELADDLRRFLEDKPIRARRPTLRQWLMKWGRRHLGVVTTAVAALVLAVVVLAFSTAWVWQENQAKNSALMLAEQRRQAAEQANRNAEEQRERAQASLGKAREAVQRMLTRVADVRLVPIPQMNEVRQSLLEDAAVLYTELIELNPDDAPAHYERGIVHLLQWHADKARDDFVRAAELEPGNADYHGKLAAYFATTQIDPDVKRSLYHARRMVELRPTDARAHGILAHAYLYSGQRNEAVDELRKGAELARGTPLEHKFLALVEQTAGTGNWRKVIAHLQKARDEDPPDPWVDLNRAEVHLALGEYEKALEAASRGLKLMDEPAGPPQLRRGVRGIGFVTFSQTTHLLTGFHCMRGRIYLRLKNYAAAREDLNFFQWIPLPGSRITWHWIMQAMAHFHLGDYKQALDNVAKGVAIDPGDVVNFTWIPPDELASCPNEDFRNGMLALAVEAIKRNPGKAGGYTTRGYLYAALKQYKEAEGDYTTAIKVATEETDRIDAYQFRHHFYLARERTQEARQDQAQLIHLLEQRLERVTDQLSPDTLQNMDNLASAYQDAGKLDLAERLWSDLLQRRQKKDGPESAATAEALAGLGLNLLMQQQSAASAGVLAGPGLNLLKQQRYDEAKRLLHKCLEIREQKLPDSWQRFDTLSLLGEALLGQQQYTEAERLLRQGYDGLKEREIFLYGCVCDYGGKSKIRPEGPRRLAEAVERLVRLYEVTQQPDKARAWREKLPPEKAPAKNQ
jgi:serine/threonine protein kinase/tetratricopeptide (TPR) repeat protein